MWARLSFVYPCFRFIHPYKKQRCWGAVSIFIVKVPQTESTSRFSSSHFSYIVLFRKFTTYYFIGLEYIKTNQVLLKNLSTHKLQLENNNNNNNN